MPPLPTATPDPQATAKAEQLEEMPFFNGSWPGTRNDWTGDVGISFVAEFNCTITALGRAADVALSETATVTLWLTESQEALATVDVGPCSPVEGQYAFETLSPGIEVQVGREYRLTQRCRGRMLDKWFDGRAAAEEVAAQSALPYAKFLGGVCRNNYGFPTREDGEFRRAGMVNFKVAPKPLDAVTVTKAELAQAVARTAACAARDRAAFEAHLLAAARVLALLVDELGGRPRLAALVAIAEEEELQKLVRLEALDGEEGLSGSLTGEAEGSSACTVFDLRFAKEVLGFAGRRGGQVDVLGRSLEGVFVVAARTGRVLAGPARIFRGPRLSSGAELVSMLGAGMLFTRSAAGSVTALLTSEARQGRALLLKPGGPGRAASSSGHGAV